MLYIIDKIFLKYEKHIFTFMVVITISFGIFVFAFIKSLDRAEKVVNIIENSDKYDFYTTCVEVTNGYACINEKEVINNE